MFCSSLLSGKLQKTLWSDATVCVYSYLKIVLLPLMFHAADHFLRPSPCQSSLTGVCYLWLLVNMKITV